MPRASRVGADGVEVSYGVIPVRRSRDGSAWEVLTVKGKGRHAHWSFPKGGVETFDADAIATATRELAEETGLSLERILCSEPFVTEYINGISNRKKRVGLFLAIVTGDVVLQEKEIGAGEWLRFDTGDTSTADAVLERLTFDGDKAVWRKAIDILSGCQ